MNQKILSELVRETTEDIAALDGRLYDLEDDLAAAPPMQTAVNGRARPT